MPRKQVNNQAAQGDGMPKRWSLALYLLLPRAVWELFLARVALSSLTVQDIERRNRNALARGGDAESTLAEMLAVQDIAFVLPRVAGRLPWRSDCLVQALAAQRWLLAKGLASAITIGAEKPAGAEFGAHAWLTHGDFVVTGGEVDRYTILFDPEGGNPVD